MSWEVWTMKSRMSFFNPTLLRKNTGRFAPLWGCLLAILLITGPFLLLRELSASDSFPGDRTGIEILRTRAGYVREYLEDFPKNGVSVGFVMAILCAAMVFKYLHKTRSAYMMHAFPMTRTCHFVTNTVSGLLFYAVPVLAMGAAYQIILLVNGLGASSGLLWLGILRWLLQYLFFYGLAVFCMVLSGRTVIAVLSYVALNFVGYLLPMLVILECKALFYGLVITVNRELAALSPLLRLLIFGQGFGKLSVIYAFVGLALLALGWYHNRVRQVERAGDAMAYGWARVAFRLVFTACCAVGIGLILTTLFTVGSDSGNLAWLLLINTLIGCFVGWFGSSMMLARTVKVFRKPRLWLGFGVFAAVLTGFILGLRFDILGWQRRVPETNEIASVEISTGESGIVLGDFNIPDDTVRLTDPADFETVRTIHRHALKNRDGYFDGSKYYSDGVNEFLHIRYHLKNGRTLERVYDVTSLQDAERIGAIYSRPEVAEQYYEKLEKLVPDRIFRATISGDVYYKDDDYSDHELVCTDPAGLKAAILADAAAGRLPVVNNFTRGTCGAAVFQLEITRMETENPETAYGLMLERIDIFETATQTLSLFEERVPD